MKKIIALVIILCPILLIGQNIINNPNFQETQNGLFPYCVINDKDYFNNYVEDWRATRSSIGVHVSIGDFAPLVNYECELTHTDNLSLSTSFHALYDWKRDIVFLPVNFMLKYGRKFKLYGGVGFVNYFDFTPYPKTKIERDNWIPDGGQWISYPYNLRPDFVVGCEYHFNRLVLSISSLNIVYWYRNYSVPDYIDKPKSFIHPVFLFGVNYKF